jgi:nucleoside-diphosphate-sugar epimerase
MSKFIKAALRNDPITIYGDGSQTRTFCYIDDNIDFTSRCMFEDIYVNDVVNVGNDEQTTILELAQIIIEESNSKSKIEFLPPLGEGDMTRRQPDIEKMRSSLSRDLLDMRSGIRLLLKQF